MKTLRLTRTHISDQFGLEQLRLALLDNGREVAYLPCCSGAQGRQNFRTRAKQVRGELEPLPEGEYQLGHLDWAGKPGDYTATFGAGLGPLWVLIDPEREIGFHLDANRATSPGTAGCVGLPDLAALQTFARWWEGGAPERLIVDWGLGSVSRPAALAQANTSRKVTLVSAEFVCRTEEGTYVKLYHNPNGTTLVG